MALRVCRCCTTRFAPGLECCPHCGREDHHEEGDDMAKITVHGGPSQAGPPAGFGGEWGDGETEGVRDGEPVHVEPAPSGLAVDDGEPEAEGDDTNSDVEPDAEPAAATPPRPATNAAKGDWVAYVEALSGEDVDGLTKTELIKLADKLESQASAEG